MREKIRYGDSIAGRHLARFGGFSHYVDELDEARRVLVDYSDDELRDSLRNVGFGFGGVPPIDELERDEILMLMLSARDVGPAVRADIAEYEKENAR